ncbi:uncharacterized protein LOC141899658 [Tubulanus polymorphus]|uniref:uncharacterized protein LOC141899658 n=1 Tax=Tubulanus polymorphus TaxID=672921 RepID=UPI003DA59011
MESYQITLEQVNFEEYDLSTYNSTELDSFSNVVSYDSELISENINDSIPTSPELSFTVGTNNVKKKYIQGKAVSPVKTIINNSCELTSEDCEGQVTESNLDKASEQNEEDNLEEYCRVHSSNRRLQKTSESEFVSDRADSLDQYREQYDITPPLYRGQPVSSSLFIDADLSEELSHQVIEDDLLLNERNLSPGLNNSSLRFQSTVFIENCDTGCFISEEEEEEEDRHSEHAESKQTAHRSDTWIEFQKTGGVLDINIVETILAKLKMSSPETNKTTVGIDEIEDEQATFTAFTSTTEALALQKSVIGHHDLTPASADEIASYLAQAELLLKQKKNSEAINDYSLPQTSAEHASASPILSMHTQESSNLIRIKPGEMEVTIDKDPTTKKSYTAPSDELKQRLKAKAKANSKSKNKKSLVKNNQGSSHPDLKQDSASPKQNSAFSQPEPFEGSSFDSPRNEVKIRKFDTPTVRDTGFEPIKSLTPEDAVNPATDLEIKDSGIDIEKIEETSFTDIPVNCSTPLKSDNSGNANQSFGFVPSSSHSFSNMDTLPSFKQITMSSRMNEDTEKLLRENANLKGQIEMFQLEARNAVRERSELQTHLAALRSQLKSQSQVSSGSLKDQEALLTEMKVLKSRHDELDRTVKLSQNALYEKSHETTKLMTDLEASKSANSKLQDKLVEMQRHIDQKEGSFQSLKLKMTEIQQDLNVVHQEKRQCINEMRTVQNDMAALSKTKEWYQQQLMTAQELRNELQKELSNVQTVTMQQNGFIEKLKSDNSVMKNQLAETQQRALHEKELLVRHLETIETDMLEREASFRQIQNESSSTEENLNQKILFVEDEKLRLASLISTTSDLEEKLRKTTEELQEKQGLVESLQREHAEMLKSLTLSQEKLFQKENDFEILEARFVDVEARLVDFQDNFTGSGSDILKLTEEKIALEVALASVNEEKRAIDYALEMLKEDMKKVEVSFKQMRQDLDSKNLHLEKVESEKFSVEKSLAEARAQIEKQKTAFEEFNNSVSDRFVKVNELNEGKANLETEVINLRNEISQLHETLQEVSQEKLNVLEKLNSAERKVIEYESHQNSNVEEKVALQARIQGLEGDGLERDKIKQENDDLKVYITEMKNQLGNEITRYQQEIEKLMQDLQTSRHELETRKSEYSDDLTSYSNKLSQVENDRKTILSEMTELQRKIAEGEITTGAKQQEHLTEQLELLTNKVEALEHKKTVLETEIDIQRDSARNEIQGYKDRISELEHHQWDLQQLLELQKQSQDESRLLALDLEREKGRLAGVLQSHGTLKQHTSELEGALAEKESSIVEISAMTQHQLNEMSKIANEHKSTIQALESALNQEREEIERLKKQLASERLNSSKLQSHELEVKSDVKLLQKDTEHLTSECNKLKNQLEISLSAEQSYRAELEALKTASRLSQLEVESLQRQLQQCSEKDPVVDAQIKQLLWQIDQKNLGVEGLKNQLQLAEQRQQAELENIQKILQTTKEDSDKLRNELNQTRREKFAHQSKLSELKGAVKASLKNKNSEDSATMGMNGQLKSDDDSSDEMYQSALSIIEKILHTESTPSFNSKPLTAVQDCLQSLQSEMSNLQRQIDDHTMAVINSNQSWKKVETQMQELKEICNSDDAASTTGSSAEETVERLLAEEIQTKKQKIALANMVTI